MHSPSRFGDPFLDTRLVPEDFAAVSRFCAGAMSPAMGPAVSSQRFAVRVSGQADLFFAGEGSVADQPGQLVFENI